MIDLPTVKNYDIRQCDPVFQEPSNPRANIRIVLNNMTVERYGFCFLILCVDRNDDEFINILELKEMLLFTYKYYKGCICSVERGLKGLPDILKTK